MECEVKDAEINILRKRILKMEEQVEPFTAPNGNEAPEDKLSPHVTVNIPILLWKYVDDYIFF